MRTEVPEFKRCCFCVPVRYGILTWGYVSLVFNCLLLLEIIGILIRIILGHYHIPYTGVYVMNGFSILLRIINFAFILLLIIAAHRKNSRLLKIYYYGQLFLLAAIFALVIAGLVYDIFYWWSDILYFLWEYLMWRLTWISYIGLQLYILAVVRSEILKLDSQLQVRFTNIAAEAECEYYAIQEGLQADKHSDTDGHANVDNTVIDNTYDYATVVAK